MENNDPYEELEIYLKQINVSAKMMIKKLFYVWKEILSDAQVAGKERKKLRISPHYEWSPFMMITTIIYKFFNAQ